MRFARKISKTKKITKKHFADYFYKPQLADRKTNAIQSWQRVMLKYLENPSDTPPEKSLPRIKIIVTSFTFNYKKLLDYCETLLKFHFFFLCLSQTRFVIPNLHKIIKLR